MFLLRRLLVDRLHLLSQMVLEHFRRNNMREVVQVNLVLQVLLCHLSGTLLHQLHLLFGQLIGDWSLLRHLLRKVLRFAVVEEFMQLRLLVRLRDWLVGQLRLRVEHLDLRDLGVVGLSDLVGSGGVVVSAVRAAVFTIETAFDVACKELFVLDVNRTSVINLTLSVETCCNIYINLLAFCSHLL